MKKLLPMMVLLTTVSGAVHAAPPAPERKEMTIAELHASIIDNDGKVIEVTANWFTSFEQKAKGEYSVYCNYHGDDSSFSSGFRISFSGEDARDFFQDLIKENDIYSYGSSGEDFYVHVEGKKLTAVGARYSKSKKKYSW